MSGYTANPFPSLVPLPLQTGAKARGFSPTALESTAETDSPLERAGFELSVPGDGELCWGALTLGCIRGDRSAGAGTVQCDFFCSAGVVFNSICNRMPVTAPAAIAAQL